MTHKLHIIHRAHLESPCLEGALKAVAHIQALVRTQPHTHFCQPARFMRGQPSRVLLSSVSYRAEMTSERGL